ncbi:MAG: helix-turn-helix transcriptional regulator [Thermodesulfobacteriota bacterium]|jgi:transcriptional regulator with XRE-family HTH domain|nr:MAG: helix-turn-helix transcriptional regulator [Thermodesulfobacteriota bacterium]
MVHFEVDSTRTYRKKLGHSQKSAAYFMGWKKTNNLSRYEHGVKLPGLINALKLEIVYRTPVAFLFRELYGQLKREIRMREESLKTKNGHEGKIRA